MAVPLKHSTSVPLSADVAVVLSVDVKEVAPVVSNPVPGLAVKTSLGPQIEEEVNVCTKIHSLFPSTLHVVSPLMSPVTVHVKVKVSPGQVGGGGVNCPVTSPGDTFTACTYILLRTPQDSPRQCFGLILKNWPIGSKLKYSCDLRYCAK